jgi:hypothetical protein
MLAESYETSRDGKLVTIGLRKGVTFHNGKEMTSADVLASLKRWQAIGANGSMVAKRIDEIRAKDKYAITVAFNKATGLFPTYLSRPTRSFRKVANAAGKQATKDLIGTGLSNSGAPPGPAFARCASITRRGRTSQTAGRAQDGRLTIRWVVANEATVRADG